MASAAAVASVTATAKPAQGVRVRSSSASSRSSPSTSTSRSSAARRPGRRRTRTSSVIYAQGKSATDDAGEIAAIQDMVASGVKGIAITPTSPAVIPALNKAVQGGREGRPDGQRPADLEEEERPSSRRTTSRAARSPASGSPSKLKAGDTLGILEGVPGVPALDDRVNGHARGSRRAKSRRSRSSRSSRPTATRRRVRPRRRRC